MHHFKDILIPPNSSLKEAMQKMTNVCKGVLIVITRDGKLAGTLSDGDIRRTILKNVSLSARVQLALNTDPVFALAKEEAILLLQNRSLQVVPVVDKDKKVIGAVTEEKGAVHYWEAGTGPAAPGLLYEMVVLIPARGGSKRIPRKNLQKVRGISLVARSIQVCKAVFPVESIVVSTDDPEIAKEARSYGVHIPWLRPVELSADSTGTCDVVLHALEKLQAVNRLPYAVILVEPTAPLRQPFHLKEAYELFQQHDPDAVVAVSELPHIYHPEEIVKISGGAVLAYRQQNTLDSRQARTEQEKLYFKNGIVYIFKTAAVLSNRKLFGTVALPYLVSSKYVADIDEPEDLTLAELKFKNL